MGKNSVLFRRGTMTMTDTEVTEMFDATSIGGVPEKVQYVVDYGNPELLRLQEGDVDEAFGRNMMDYKGELMPMMTGGRRRKNTRKQTKVRRRTKTKARRRTKAKVHKSIRHRRHQ